MATNFDYIRERLAPSASGDDDFAVVFFDAALRSLEDNRSQESQPSLLGDRVLHDVIVRRLSTEHGRGALMARFVRANDQVVEAVEGAGLSHKAEQSILQALSDVAHQAGRFTATCELDRIARERAKQFEEEYSQTRMRTLHERQQQELRALRDRLDGGSDSEWDDGKTRIGR